MTAKYKAYLIAWFAIQFEILVLRDEIKEEAIKKFKRNK